MMSFNETVVKPGVHEASMSLLLIAAAGVQWYGPSHCWWKPLWRHLPLLKWHGLQERSEDLRVFVEVLQSLTPEPEDLLHLRASESSLREKVARLEASLEGHQLQQTIKALQEAEVSLSIQSYAN